MSLDFLKQAVKNAVPARYHIMMDVTWSRLTWPLYAGNAVCCPICRGRFRRFLPHKHRQGVRCPRCRSYERHRLLWIYLTKRTDLFCREGIKLLHVAPEYLLQRIFKQRANIDYLSADLQSPIAMMHFDLTSIPLPDDSFDAILCSHVLEHIPDDRAAIRELVRVLRPGGWAIFQVPQIDADATDEDPTLDDPRERERRFGQHDHFRLYGRDFSDRLGEAGFCVRVDRFAARLPSATVRKYGLIHHEDLFYCRKRDVTPQGTNG